MPTTAATFFRSYSDLPSLIVSNVEPYLSPSMFKAAGANAFVVGDLLARDAGGNIVPFTWTAEAADIKFAGFCAYDTGIDATDIRVVTKGALKAALLKFVEVKDNVGAASNFTLAKFLALPTVSALVYDEFTFSGQAVLQLSGVDGQYTI